MSLVTSKTFPKFRKEAKAKFRVNRIEYCLLNPDILKNAWAFRIPNAKGPDDYPPLPPDVNEKITLGKITYRVIDSTILSTERNFKTNSVVCGVLILEREWD